MSDNEDLKKPNRCIGCAYLTTFRNHIHYTLNYSDRCDILDGRENHLVDYNELDCYKHNVPDIFKISSECSKEDAAKKVSQAICQNKGWQLFHDGITADVAFQREQQLRSFKWTKTSIIIAIIGLIATLAVLGLTIYVVFFSNS